MRNAPCRFCRWLTNITISSWLGVGTWFKAAGVNVMSRSGLEELTIYNTSMLDRKTAVSDLSQRVPEHIPATLAVICNAWGARHRPRALPASLSSRPVQPSAAPVQGGIQGECPARYREPKTLPSTPHRGHQRSQRGGSGRIFDLGVFRRNPCRTVTGSRWQLVRPKDSHGKVSIGSIAGPPAHERGAWVALSPNMRSDRHPWRRGVHWD